MGACGEADSRSEGCEVSEDLKGKQKGVYILWFHQGMENIAGLRSKKGSWLVISKGVARDIALFAWREGLQASIFAPTQ